VLVILGYVVIFFAVVGGFLYSGGALNILFQPTEFFIIGGAGFGAFIVGNNRSTLKKILITLPGLFKRSRYTKALYMDLLVMMYLLLTKIRQEGMLAVENDIEDPQSSIILNAYPHIVEHPALMRFLLDYLRLIISGNMNAYEMQALMDEEIETHEQEEEVTANALSILGDALPAFGIVAAVMGVINALAAIDRPMIEMGQSIAHAMVGTFLGILLAYGFVMPLASLLRQKSAEKTKILQCVKVTLLASLQGYPPRISIEFGRKTLFSAVRPLFSELEDYVRFTKSSPANTTMEKGV